MALINYGVASGLAYVHDFNADINRAQTNDILNNQARIEHENQVALLGQKLTAKHLETTWDNQQLQQFVEKKTQDIGAFVMQNPNYKEDPLLYRQYNTMMNELEDNDFVKNSMNANTNYMALTKFIADNPGSENDPQIQAQLTAYDNYNKTGSTDGVTANGKKFYFASPDTFDPTTAIGAVYGKLKPTESYVSGHGLGATETKVSDSTMMATAASILSGPDSYKYQRAWNAMSDSQKSFYNNDPVSWVATIGKGFTGSSVDAGTYFAPKSGGSDSGKAPVWSPMLHDMYRVQQSNSPVFLPNVSKALPMVNGQIQIEGSLKIPTTGTDGKISFINIPGYDGQLVDANPLGRTQFIGGIPWTQVQVKVPMSKALVLGENAVFEDTSWGLGTWQGGDVKEKDVYKPVASLARDKDGKIISDDNGNPYALITTYVQVPTNPIAQRNYDAAETTPTFATTGESVRQKDLDQNTAFAMAAAMGFSGLGTDASGRYVSQNPKGQWIHLDDGTPMQ